MIAPKVGNVYAIFHDPVEKTRREGSARVLRINEEHAERGHLCRVRFVDQKETCERWIYRDVERVARVVDIRSPRARPERKPKTSRSIQYAEITVTIPDDRELSALEKIEAVMEALPDGTARILLNQALFELSTTKPETLVKPKAKRVSKNTKARIRDMIYNPERCAICIANGEPVFTSYHRNAFEYFACHLNGQGYQSNFAHHEKTVEDEAAALAICACGHHAQAHKQDALDNWLECGARDCGCDHFHNEIENDSTIENESSEQQVSA